MRTTTTLQEVLELAANQLRNVDERPQRPRRKQRLTRTPQDPARRPPFLAEPAHHRGLPNPRLASDEHKSPLPAVHHRRQQIAQSRQMIAALKQPRRQRAPHDR